MPKRPCRCGGRIRLIFAPADSRRRVSSRKEVNVHGYNFMNKITLSQIVKFHITVFWCTIRCDGGSKVDAGFYNSRSPGRPGDLIFSRWHLMCLGPQNNSCFFSPIWAYDFEVASRWLRYFGTHGLKWWGLLWVMFGRWPVGIRTGTRLFGRISCFSQIWVIATRDLRQWQRRCRRFSSSEMLCWTAKWLPAFRAIVVLSSCESSDPVLLDLDCEAENGIDQYGCPGVRMCSVWCSYYRNLGNVYTVDIIWYFTAVIFSDLQSHFGCD